MPVAHKSKYDFALPECDGDVLQISELEFAYPDGHKALYGVSLNLCQGDKVALVGPNGAGKSTLMLHLNGILSGQGHVNVGGMELTHENLPIISSCKYVWRRRCPYST